MKEKIKENQFAAYFFAFGMFAGTGVFAVGSDIVERGQEAISDLIFETFIGGIENLISGVFGAITSGINEFISETFGLMTEAITAPARILEALFGSMADATSGIFDVGLIANPEVYGFAMTAAADGAGAAPLGVASIGWGMIGVTLAGIGTAVITGTDIPILDEFADGIGTILIVMGPMLAVWGFFPDLSQWIIGLTFGTVFMAAAVSWIQLQRSVM